MALLSNKTIIKWLSNTPVSFLSGVLAVNANWKNVALFLTSNFGVVDRQFRQIWTVWRSPSSSAHVKHSVIACGSKCNFNCMYAYFYIYTYMTIRLWPWMRYIERRLLQQHRKIDRRTNSHSLIGIRHTRPEPRLSLPCTNTLFHKYSLHPHSLNVCLPLLLHSTTSLCSVDVVPLKMTAGVVENSGYCIYFMWLKCFLNSFSLLHLVIYICIYIYVHIICM